MTLDTMIIPPRVQFVDPRTGMISREWYRFLLNLFDRTGGPNPDTTDSLLALAPNEEVNYEQSVAIQGAYLTQRPSNDQILSMIQEAILSFQRFEPAQIDYDPTAYCAPRYEPS